VITTQLPFGEIGFTDGNTIYIDATAAGFGWYTGLAGAFDANGLALAGGPAVGHMDLLTVVLHEIGHTLGLPDDCGCGPYTTLMQATLPAGVRRSLSNAVAASAPAVLAPSGSAQLAPSGSVAPALPSSTKSSAASRPVQRSAGARTRPHRRAHRAHHSRSAARPRHRGAGPRQ
jgi:hypothetical protein